MKKIICIIFSLCMFSTVATAENFNMVGVKYGLAGLQGTAASHTSGSITRSSNTDHVESEYGSLFAEYAVQNSPFSVGVEYVPFDGVISIDHGSSVDSSATISDYTTIYAMATKSFNNGVGLYGRLGYSFADLSVKANSDDTTINSADDDLKGYTAGFGIQSPKFSAADLISRLEVNYTAYDDLNVNTTSNGSDNVAKKATDIESATISISFAKTF